MGVKLLNTFIKTNYPTVITNECGFSQLRGKRIAIDISIYLYRFKTLENFVPGLYRMCNLFVKYNIKPIFVFDGGHHKAKHIEIDTRRERRETIKEVYNCVSSALDVITEKTTRENIIKNMYDLKKNFTRLSYKNIVLAKQIVKYYGFPYIFSEEEADEVCGYLYTNDYVDYAMSEDSDLFMYGAMKVIRNVNIEKEQFDIYNVNNLLSQMNVCYNQFIILCILSGCDYYKTRNNIFKNFNRQVWLRFNDIYTKDRHFRESYLLFMNNREPEFKSTIQYYLDKLTQKVFETYKNPKKLEIILENHNLMHDRSKQ
jgi:hypothetical protein